MLDVLRITMLINFNFYDFVVWVQRTSRDITLLCVST